MSAHKARRAGLEVVQNPPSVLSSGMYRPPAFKLQTAAAAVRCRGGGREEQGREGGR